MDTEQDLAFDATDALAAATKQSGDAVTAYGCPVRHVHRLERHWYIVSLYTNTGWPGC